MHEHAKKRIDRNADAPSLPDRLWSSLHSKGWARFGAGELNLSDGEWRDLIRLCKHSADLPPDRFGNGGRHRCYAEGILATATGSITWNPGYQLPDGSFEIRYQQEAEYQPEYGGVMRSFRKAPDNILALGLLHKLIACDLALTGMGRQFETLLCGVHIIRMRARAGEPARITPDCFHRDGQPFTAVYLLERQSVNGGKNYIAPPEYSGCSLVEIPPQQLSTFTLDFPLDSYIINDEAFSHYVSPVTCAEDAPYGVRTGAGNWPACRRCTNCPPTGPGRWNCRGAAPCSNTP